MASYRISFKRSVEKDFRKIDKSKLKKIFAAIEELAGNPMPSSSRKLVGSRHTYRLRVGDYRVLYFLLPESNEIEIQKVRHRKDVYR